MAPHTKGGVLAGTELLWVGDGAWCACDADLAPDDPRRVIAYVECRNHQIEVVWVRERRATGRFATLREALTAIEVAAHSAARIPGPALEHAH